MKRIKRLRMNKRVTCVLAIFAVLALETTALWPVPTYKMESTSSLLIEESGLSFLLSIQLGWLLTVQGTFL